MYRALRISADVAFRKPEIQNSKLETNPKSEGSEFRISGFYLRPEGRFYIILRSLEITLELGRLLQKYLLIG
jgi:hypothetical protein